MAYFKSIGCTSWPECTTHEARPWLECDYEHFALFWVDDEVGFELEFEGMQHIIHTFLEQTRTITVKEVLHFLKGFH